MNSMKVAMQQTGLIGGRLVSLAPVSKKVKDWSVILQFVAIII
jgi:hypothetical protein